MNHSAWPDFELLDALLAREQMAHSPDVWIHIHYILLHYITDGRKLDQADELALVLGPLVCKNPSQQERIHLVLHEWLQTTAPTSDTTVQIPAAASVSAKLTEAKNLQRLFNQRWLIISLLVMLSLGSGGYYGLTYDSEPPSHPNPVVIDGAEPKAPDTNQTTTPVATNIAVDDQIAPNPQPMPILLPKSWQWLANQLPLIGAALPWCLLLPMLLWLYRARRFLKPNNNAQEQRIRGLRFNTTNNPAHFPYTGPEIAIAAERLLRPQWTESRRLDETRTAEATAQNYGYFRAVYRQTHRRPEYLVLVQSHHNGDQLAALAELLFSHFKQQQVAVRSYRFIDDPRRLFPWLQPNQAADTSPLSLKQLSERHPDSRLIIISSWQIVFQPYQPDLPQDWVAALQLWSSSIWLSPGYANARAAKDAAQQAQRLNIKLLPLTAQQLPSIATWLAQPTGKVPLGQTDDDYLPPLLTHPAHNWLSWQPPYAVDLAQLLKELRDFLGESGLLLLQALAVFPKPLWPLPLLLDIQLFSETDTVDNHHARQQREQRLLKLGRLPWMRHNYLPDYLREYLLKNLSAPQRKHITSIWTALAKQLSHSEQTETLQLPIATVPKSRWHWRLRRVKQPQQQLLNDAIFINILRGGKLGLLDFQLPKLLSRWLGAESQWLDLRPLMLGSSLAIMLNVLLYPYLAQHSKPWLEQHWQNRQQTQNADWTVELNYQDNTRPLAAALQIALQQNGFATADTLASTPVAQSNQNRIDYATGGQLAAQRIQQQLAWLSYQAPVQLNLNPALAEHTLHVQLRQSYQHGSGFQDSLMPSSKAETRLPFEPETVVVPAGQFLMGSSYDESGRITAEGPQHKVEIRNKFAIGKTEITFAQYDAFADATNRKKPNDDGWGRGDRPVINIKFSDAEAYVEWLSNQTGKHYRLPTESEWEYIARAGSKTIYWWGNEVGTNNAVCIGCNSKWDNLHTAPVASFKPNTFGIYDTAGNVWEWTSDCWHKNYESAPNNETSWNNANQGDCSRRVVRGGSWSYNKGGLRSAGRGWAPLDMSYDYIGFRVARTL